MPMTTTGKMMRNLPAPVGQELSLWCDQCECCWALSCHGTPSHSSPGLLRQTALTSALWQWSALVVAPLGVKSTKMSPCLSKETTAITFSYACIWGGEGGVNMGTGRLPCHSLCLTIESYTSWEISISWMPFTQDIQITDHTSSFKCFYSSLQCSTDTEKDVLFAAVNKLATW
jgi:hypothetical protein